MMLLNSQSQSIDTLKKYAELKRQSIIISGIHGCGKSHLAGLYAEFLKVQDYIVCKPKIDELRTIMQSRYTDSQKPIVIGIENIETGVLSAESSLLKFLEEPPRNTYIVITTSNVGKISGTILSRCFICSVQPPTKFDLELYLNTKYFGSIQSYHYELTKYAKTYKQIDLILSLDVEHLSYIKSILPIIDSGESVSSIVWKMQHYADGKDTPMDIVLDYLISEVEPESRHMFIKCCDTLSKGNMSTNAVLSKCIFDYKYRNQLHPQK